MFWVLKLLFFWQYTIPVDTPNATPKPQLQRARNRHEAASSQNPSCSSECELGSESKREVSCEKNEYLASSSAASPSPMPLKVATTPADLSSGKQTQPQSHPQHNYHHSSCGSGSKDSSKNNQHHHKHEGDHTAILAKMKSKMTDEEVYAHLRLLISEGSPMDKYRKLEKIGQGCVLDWEINWYYRWFPCVIVTALHFPHIIGWASRFCYPSCVWAWRVSVLFLRRRSERVIARLDVFDMHLVFVTDTCMKIDTPALVHMRLSSFTVVFVAFLFNLSRGNTNFRTGLFF